MDFQSQITESSGIHVIRLSGRLLGKEQTEDLTNRVEELVQSGQNRFVADLENLQHMNSTGLNILISFLTKARNGGGELIIVNVPDSINKLLIMTKLNKVFSIEATLEDGISALNQPAG